MDLADSLGQLSARIPQQLAHVATEEATKNALVLPFINTLGYNVFDPSEVVPEFTADVGIKKGEKVDYLIKHDGRPAILIECKTVGSKLNVHHASQLFRYFAVTDARFAILTNGVNYQFFTDIEATNKMDEKPFFEFSMLHLDGRVIDQLGKFAKTAFDLDDILSTASELKYKKQIQNLLAGEIDNPSEEFVRLFFKQVQGGSFSASAKEQFTRLVREALREFVSVRVNERLKSALSVADVPETDDDPSPVAEDDGIVTTDEEIEGYHIVRAILARHTDPARIVMRDTKSYCGILLDDNNRKPLCRLRFNYSQKYLGIFDASKDETKHAIDRPHGIYTFADDLVRTLGYYDRQSASSPDGGDEQV